MITLWFGFLYFHSIKTHSNNYLYVKCVVFLFQMLTLTYLNVLRARKYPEQLLSG